MHLKELMATNH